MSLEQFRQDFTFTVDSLGEIDQKSLQIFFEVQKYDLPVFFPERWHPIDPSHTKFYQDPEEIELVTVPIDQIQGIGWIFTPDFDGYAYPHADTLAYCFMHSTPHELLPLDGIRTPEGWVYINDGNHRLYSAFLRGWSHVPVRLMGEIKHKR